MGAGTWENGFRGRKGSLNEEALRGAPYPKHLFLFLKNLGVLMSSGDMPFCRHPFMYAQEATGLPLLLEVVYVWAGGGAPDCYCSSWGCEQSGLDLIRKERLHYVIYKSLRIP